MKGFVYHPAILWDDLSGSMSAQGRSALALSKATGRGAMGAPPRPLYTHKERTGTGRESSRSPVPGVALRSPGVAFPAVWHGPCKARCCSTRRLWAPVSPSPAGCRGYQVGSEEIYE